MFQRQTHSSGVQSGFAILELIYHSTVRSVRKTHGNAIMALVKSMTQTFIMVAVFYFLFDILGLRGSALRGDFLLYIMSGIFLFLTHNKAMGAVAGAPSPVSAMMLHAPMNTTIAIASAAIGSLYTQVLALFLILFLYHAAVTPIEIFDPVMAFAMLLLSWFSGVAIGMVFLAIRPWAPATISAIQQVYSRANMITSGKMFVANALPGTLLPIFDWNPLFHSIDQARGFVFVNYNPHFSNITYPLILSLVLITLGLMGEFYSRKHVSISWSAGK